MVKVVGIARKVRPVKAKIGVSGGIKLHEGSVEGARLHQKNRAQPPAADDPVQHSIGIAQQAAPLADRKFVHHGRDPAMFAGAADVAVVPSQVVLVHRVARNFPGKAGAGPRFGVRQILRPGPGRLESEPVGILVDHLGLHRLIGADGSAGTDPDFSPGWKRCRSEASAFGSIGGLIEIRAPGELIRAVGDIRDTQGGVAMELAFDRQVPLDAVRVFFVPLIRSKECLRTKARPSGLLSGHWGTGRTPGRQNQI